MVKIISRDDYVKNRLFVLCDCGIEVAEFYRTDDDEIVLTMHDGFKRRRNLYYSFCFNGEVDLSIFINNLKDFINATENTPIDPMVFFDKYFTYKNKMPGTIVTMYDSVFFSIELYENPKKVLKNRNVIWQFLIRKEQAKELIENLKEI